jgi:transposase
MSLAALLPPVPDLLVEQVILGEECLTFVARLTTAQVPCPSCRHFSRQVHSRARRTLFDLPVAGRRVRLSLQVRRFFCRAPGCPRRTFREQLPTLAAPWARRTERLQAILRQIGFALGGEAGARLAAQLGMPWSADTLLRLVQQAPAPPAPTPRVLGIDDWSFLRGKTYGTILLDLERRVPIDLLPDREVDTCVAWLQAHPGIELISRDRGKTYAQAASLGAPLAKQIADRWHLLRGLGEALQKLLAQQERVLGQVAREVDVLHESAPPPAAAPPSPPVRSQRVSASRPVSAQRAWQLETYQQVQELAAHSWTQQAITNHLQISRSTVGKYMALDHFIDRRHNSHSASAEPYRAYLEHRWAEGCTNRRELWHELQEQGFTGGYISVWRVTCTWVLPVSPQATTPPPTVQPRPGLRTPRQVAWVLTREEGELKKKDVAYRAALCQNCPEIALAAELVRGFATLVRERKPGALDAWLEQAESSGLRELRRFALGLRQDYAAVRAALEEPWSQGPTEGHIQRLKTLKRQMYGRASFGLLRQRVLDRPDEGANVPTGCHRAL